MEGLRDHLQNQDHSKLTLVAKYALDHLSEFQPQEEALILTDDRAPTEKLIYEMIKNRDQEPS